MATAADETQPDNDPLFFENLLSDPNGYRYTGLLRMIGGDVPVKRTKPR